MQELHERGVRQRAASSDPDRGPPPSGGLVTGDPLFDLATGGTGGYNQFWLDSDAPIAVFDGEARSSLITRPRDGRIPALTTEGRQRLERLRRGRRQFGEFDNPENRPLAERCLLSFGSNAGPPMLPNYFYNNNYVIVQTPAHVMIMTEMVHDVRIIRLDPPDSLPADVRPWMGDSRGTWKGDTLVVVTTNIPTQQLDPGAYVSPSIPGGSEGFKVIERFTRADEQTINYEFTVVDSATYTQAWGGEIPFRRQDGQVYEYACHEANYAMTHVLGGARAEERADSFAGRARPPD